MRAVVLEVPKVVVMHVGGLVSLPAREDAKENVLLGVKKVVVAVVVAVVMRIVTVNVWALVRILVQHIAGVIALQLARVVV